MRLFGTALMASVMWACSDDEIKDAPNIGNTDKPQWYYAGG